MDQKTQFQKWRFNAPFLARIPNKVILGVSSAVLIGSAFFYRGRIESVIARYDQRSAVQQRAEQLSVESQKKRAIAAHDFSVSPTGETTFAIVRMEDRNPRYRTRAPNRAPSGRLWYGAVLVIGMIYVAVRRQRRLDAGLDPNERRDDDDDD